MFNYAIADEDDGLLLPVLLWNKIFYYITLYSGM